MGAKSTPADHKVIDDALGTGCVIIVNSFHFKTFDDIYDI